MITEDDLRARATRSGLDPDHFVRFVRKRIAESGQTCGKCQTFKRLDAYGRDSARPNGLASTCRSCRASRPADEALEPCMARCLRCRAIKPLEAFEGKASCSSCRARDRERRKRV